MKKKVGFISLLLVLFCLAGCTGAKPEVQNSTENRNCITAATTAADSLDLKKDNLPIVLEKYGIEVTDFVPTKNSFVEDGSNRKCGTIASIVVRNISGRDITLASISFTVNDEYASAFNITTLPANASVTVQESNGLKFDENDDYKFVTANVTFSDGFKMNEDKIAVTAKGDSLTAKNISGEDYEFVYVYYKTVATDGSFFGGITYRTKFENLKAGESKTEKTQNFSAYSKILMVEAF